MRGAALLICGLWSVACGSHVELKVPEVTAPTSERVEAYQRLHLPPNNKGLFRLSFSETDGFLLANGLLVYHTKDLLSVVPEDSATALWVDRERKATFGSVALLAGGVAFLGWGLGNARLPIAEDIEWHITLLSTSILLIFASSQLQGYARIAKSLALQSYNFSLRTQLGLCQSGGVVFDCSSTKE